jgi:tRNA-dihydrouridine synthase
MTGRQTYAALLGGSAPILALAPMQDVTDLPFWRLMARYGGADLYFTEYFRVFPNSRLNAGILRSITENPTGRPVVAQMIGNEIPELVRIARELQQYPIAGVDLNLGCPAPVVYRKCAGGGLLREPEKVDAILGALRDAVTGRLSVKTRLGFDSPAVFDDLLPILARHNLDLVTVHGRTVREMYRSEVHYDYIARAAAELPCPVLANGNVHSAAKARSVLEHTGARGLMIGRGAIRNPWLFQQCRQLERGEPVFVPRGIDVLEYLRLLYEAIRADGLDERGGVQRIKKHMNYIALGVEPTGRFLHEVRRVRTEPDFWRLCAAFLEHDRAMELEPFPLALHERDVLAGVQD